jgi:hypothetical protein
MIKGIKPTPKITFSEPLKDSEFAYCEMTINNIKKIKAIVCNNKQEIIEKAEKKIKDVKTIHIQIIQKDDKNPGTY